jgi:hypothetical protein
LLACATLACAQDILIVNGKIVTGDDRGSVAEAMVVRGDRIQAVGPAAQLRRQYGSGARLVDLKGRTVIPGLIDTHTHGLDWATSMVRGEIDLRYPEVKSIAEVQRLVGARAKSVQPGQWIRGLDWDDGTLAENRYVLKGDLDAAAPDNPVFLMHATGHLAAVNSAALKLAGISSKTADPVGGVIDRDAGGEPTGILKDGAMGLVMRLTPRATQEERVSAVGYFARACAEVGLTMIHDVSLRPEDLWAYQEARRRGLLKVRVRLAQLVDNQAALVRLRGMGVHTGFGDSWLKLGGAKIFADGGMAARTVAIYAPPVLNEPGNIGILMWKTEDLQSFQMALAEQGWQLTTHAIGDRAIDQVIDSYARVAQKFPDRDLRNRIIHDGIATPAIQQRLKEWKILVDNNPPFVYFLGRHFSRYGRDRMRWIYPGKSYFDNGIMVSGGSDVYVTPLSPWFGLWAAVVRKEMMTGEVLAPEERLTVAQALRLYTYNGAYASFEEKDMGTIEAGKLANFVVIDRDLLTVPADQIKDIRVLATWNGGEMVYERQ